MGRVTCYKLCYAMGVEDRLLEKDFCCEHRVAARFEVFKDSVVLQRFRALSALYVVLIHDYYGRSGKQELMTRWRENCEAATSISEDEVPSELPALEIMRWLAVLRTAMMHKVYTELAICLPFSVFETVVSIPIHTAQTAAQAAFIVSKTDRVYGLHFWNQEILNIASASMLSSDLFLRDRLSLLTGIRLPRLEDKSGFGVAVKAYINSAFIKEVELWKRPNVYVLRGGTKNIDALERVCDKAPEPLKEFDGEFVDGITIVTADAFWVYNNSPKHPNVEFVVPLPTASRYYRLWKSRRLENVFLLSQRP